MVSFRSWQGALTCGGACGCSGESSLLGAVEKATVEAEKHGDRSEKLSALVAEAREMLEQAKTKQTERARAAAEEATAVKAAAAKQERLAALALEVQQVQTELGSGSGTPQPGGEETMCVVCFDAPKDHIIIPCGHQCVCGTCAEALKREAHPACPLCREPISVTAKAFLG